MSSRSAQTDDPGHRRVVLLRGINVGKGGRIAMSDLIECTEAAGGTSVRTVLATGNVIVTDKRPVPELRAALEAAYAERFGYRSVLQVLPLDDVATMASSYPFDTLPEHHDYVVFSDDPEVTTRVAVAMHAAIREVGEVAAGTDAHAGAGMTTSSTEAVAEGAGCVYWRVPRGSTLTSDASAVLDGRENKGHLTTRNLKTLARILAAG
ncbi:MULTISPECIES: DUF1697 domain-containing protein [unclassified Dietzia]|uniref:DUF1697 domain-containing protein n=1 Tax=unclassified Dietzia TaxID=2617939 RepID=UPI0015F7EC89|nr:MULTISPECIES: DUF1697 domain-containing protein [unclassified Dietzia]MBB1023271.1 DUF1697 domain-containing protein [Dietzia sp. DQ12-76]MBB1028825.1 DUF1697 domain-containing protein [Dietzia sp. DQ11-38-2]